MSSTVDGQQEWEKRFSAPMPWVGVYIAAASLICTLAIAADLIHGFRNRKLWFPCKYFTLNAASLTVIAVAMKLPVDLNNSMPRGVDQAAKLSSNAFMCIIMANFMPSLGPMSSSVLLMNVTALGILVITIIVNVAIQISTGVMSRFFTSYLFDIFLICLLLLLTSSALMVPFSKKILERKYLEMHRIARLDESERLHTDEKLIEDVSKYWIMAETSDAQFVVACSPTCSTSGMISFFVAYIAIGVGISSIYESFGYFPVPLSGESDYRWSVFPIVWIQCIGAVVGSIAPFFRLFRAFSFKLSLKQTKMYLRVYKIETYWIQMLVDWKSSRIPLQFRCLKFQKFVHGLRNFTLNCMIGIQIFIVVISKTTQLSTMFLVILLSSCWYCFTWPMRKLKGKLGGSKVQEASADDSATRDLSRYVLQLQDEVELANRTLNRISKAVDKLIKEAEKKQPSNLMKLLEKSSGFEGVGKFDNDQVPLCSSKHPNSWSLVVVNLTSIVIALVEAKKGIDDCLLSGISEGLLLVHLIEESLDPTEENMVNARKAASNVWLQVELYRRWLDEDLQNKALKGKTSVEILQQLSNTAKRILSKSKKRMNGGPADSSFLKVVAANSMYRISQSILLDHEGSEGQTDEMLFDKLSVMIADILSMQHSMCHS